MSTVFGHPAGPASASAWDQQVSAIEQGLVVLDAALAQGDPVAVAQGAQGLHDTLSRAMIMLRQASGGRAPSLPADVIRRLTDAQTRARAHQQAVVRGRIATERTLDVLLPREGDSTYQALAGGVSGRVAAAYR
jgi:hypothetical protein